MHTRSLLIVGGFKGGWVQSGAASTGRIVRGEGRQKRGHHRLATHWGERWVRCLVPVDGTGVADGVTRRGGVVTVTGGTRVEARRRVGLDPRVDSLSGASGVDNFEDFFEFPGAT